jgi:hypothetical protein
VTGVRLYWARNDGMTGHVFLDPLDRAAIEREMDLQGLGFPRLEPGIHVTITEVDAALEAAAQDPISVDERLWADWLRFLEGASANGGLLAR